MSERICSKRQKKRRFVKRYDNVFKTAWTDEFHFIKHSRKVNRFAFCEFCRTATECTILRPSEKKFIFSWFYHTIFKVLTTQILVVLQNFILNTISDWFNDKELTTGSFRYKLRGKQLRKGPK
jgi:hypothetical protein